MPVQQLISEEFNGEIWRMEIDEVSEILFIEARENAEKKVSFGAVNLINGEVLFKDLYTNERWLTGIETAYDSVLLLHNYQTESGPTHRGLEAIDAFTSKTIWSNYNYAFDHLSVNGPVIYDTRIQPRKLFLLEIKTGETTRIYEPTVYKQLTNNIVQPLLKTPEPMSLDLIPVHPFGNTIHYLVTLIPVRQ